MSTVLRFFRWVFEKLATGGLIAVLAVAGFAAWYFLKDNVDFTEMRSDLLRTLNGERSRSQAALEDVKARIIKLDADKLEADKKAEAADNVVKQLKDLRSTWDRIVGNPEQQKSNEEQITRMEKVRDDAHAQAEGLKVESTRSGWERDGLEIALGKLDARLKAAEADKNAAAHYLNRAWERTKKWVVGALLIYTLGPSAAKLLFFFALAPLIAMGRPIRLSTSPSQPPTVAPSRVSVSAALAAGERLWVKERYLQASDEGLSKKSRMLLDWRIPFTCAASGLVELVEMRNTRLPTSGNPTVGTGHVTLSDQSNAHIELTTVELSEGASIVLRPSFIAGVIVPEKRRLVIRRRWQLFRWQSWITLQFRFFEFVGPCRIILAGSRGVRVEQLGDGLDGTTARRINQDATIGFTPALDYRPVRAETFWGYYRGMNPLFDDLFAGRGLFLCQEISTPADSANARKFWSRVWSGALRAFGL